MTRTSIALALLAQLSIGCGGKVLFEGSGAGGASTTTDTSTVTSTVTATATASVTSTTSTGAQCPASPHINGLCEIEGQTCPAPHSCCNGDAICQGGKWIFSEPECGSICNNCADPQFEPPTGFACDVSAICVTIEGDALVTYHCEEDLCPGQNDCGCDSSLCEGLTCEQHTQTSLLCDCPNC